ncbi:uncharacterized protein LOC106131490 [Amyelois transitella]|uniref:uncharacterized protein LOC106131490 n=1 Tax=Amyelois transitella TaxID=680683 RepID=UPI00298FC0D7|nr:uncharacterized protein LOC106131490 [Amyelois transitella]
MRSHVSFVLLVSCVLGVRVNRLTNKIVAETREQLSPNLIPCGLNDIIILSAPIVNHNVSIFQLTNPNGDIRNLDLSMTKDAIIPDDHENSIVVKYDNNKERIITMLNSYKIFNINYEITADGLDDVFANNVHDIKDNEFLIGPVSEEDHGNWVLSLFALENGRWLEMFQVITIKIKEYITPKEKSQSLHKGATFRFGFAYPIPNLESCEFTAPKTTYDRWYDRDQDNLDSCMFIVKNITKDDEGLWRVVGVGRIVYMTQVILAVV